MLHKWLKAGYMEEHRLYPTEEGVPQGGPISPVIANMALDGMEKYLRERLPKRMEGQKTKVNLVRFADDFILTGYSQVFLEESVKPLVEQYLQERGLELSAEKTTLTHIQDGFDFLGQNLRKYGGKLIIKPSKKEHPVIAGESPAIDESQPPSTSRKPDPIAQSHHSRLGSVSSTCGQQGGL